MKGMIVISKQEQQQRTLSSGFLPQTQTLESPCTA